MRMLRSHSEKSRAPARRAFILAPIALLLATGCGGVVLKRKTTSAGDLAGGSSTFSAFSAGPGATHGDISIELSPPLEGYVENASMIYLIAREGTVAPEPTACSSSPDAPYRLVNSFDLSVYTGAISWVDDINAGFKTAYSYRACLMDANDSVISSSVVEGAESLDTVAPVASSGFILQARRDGSSRHKLFLTMACNFDADLAAVRVYRAVGGTAPAATCDTGELVYQNTIGANSWPEALTPSAAGTYSYRYCVYDSSGNYASTTLLSQIANGLAQADPAAGGCI